MTLFQSLRLSPRLFRSCNGFQTVGRSRFQPEVRVPVTEDYTEGGESGRERDFGPPEGRGEGHCDLKRLSVPVSHGTPVGGEKEDVTGT